MARIISRSDAGLPSVPGFINHRSLNSWTGIRIHHTGGPFSSWRAVHDWQTEGRSPGDQLAYIGYSFGIADGQVTELRGFDHHPAHDFINTHLGVVFGGNFQNGLPSDADLDALVWFIGEAERRCGALPISTHREVGQTACPGSALHGWVKQTLPDRLEEDMPTASEIVDEMMSRVIDKVDPESGVHPRMQFKNFVRWTHHHTVDNLQATDRQDETLKAILAAVSGGDHEAVLEKINQHHTEQLERLGGLQDLLDRAATERGELAELVEKHGSGELTADQVVDELSRRLGGGGTE